MDCKRVLPPPVYTPAIPDLGAPVKTVLFWFSVIMYLLFFLNSFIENLSFSSDKKNNMKDNKWLPVSSGLIIRKTWEVAWAKVEVLIVWNKRLWRFQISSNGEVSVCHDAPLSQGFLEGVQFPSQLTLHFLFSTLLVSRYLEYSGYSSEWGPASESPHADKGPMQARGSRGRSRTFADSLHYVLPLR